MVLAGNQIEKSISGPSGVLTILHALDIAVPAGEAVAIVGPSGSGKSTLLGILAGLDTPTTGTVHMLGESLSELDEDERLLPGLTALENVMLPLELASAADAAERAMQMLEQVGLADRATHQPLQLSGGEQQRVAIARAFVAQPALLFADEPTGNLDSATGHKITDLMFSLREQLGSALVLVTHDDKLALRCDRRLRMGDGKLAVV
ncbi:UNVERIFIED_CONTAM: hypothetical protein GTU68_019643 [Idotea baltica]|nr:hypothetical protein [Idotea baltica]